MMPLFPALTGKGTLQTSQLALKDFPALEKVVDVTKLQFLDDPTLRSLSTAFQIRDGRLLRRAVRGEARCDHDERERIQRARPVAAVRAQVCGCRGPSWAAPRTRRSPGWCRKGGQAGIDLAAAPEIELGIQLGGTVTSPSVKVDVGSVASSVKEGVQQAVTQAATEKVSAEATQLVQEAEQRAAAIRLEASVAGRQGERRRATSRRIR